MLMVAAPWPRHTLVLNKFEGLTHVEIASRLGMSTKTVRRHIARALEHCAARLGASAWHQHQERWLHFLVSNHNPDFLPQPWYKKPF